jgi:ATP-dependent metalloprotease FtsH
VRKNEKANRRMSAMRERRRSLTKFTAGKSFLGRNVIHTGWAFLQRYRRQCLTATLLTILAVLLIGLAGQIHLPTFTSDSAAGGTATISYTTLLDQVRHKNVRAVAIRNEDVYILFWHALLPTAQTSQTEIAATDANEYAAWSNGLGLNGGPTAIFGIAPLVSDRSVYANVPAVGMPLLMDNLHAEQVEVVTLPPAMTSVWLPFVLRSLPFLVVIGILVAVWYMRNSQGLSGKSQRPLSSSRRNAAGRTQQRGPLAHNSRRSSSQAAAGKEQAASAARVYEIPAVTFNDVAGIDEVRQELIEVVQFLRDPEKFKRLGAHIPRGVLLSGAPGTGKTLLAKAVAGEAAVPFFRMSASEFVEMYVGVGASRVRDLFNEARSVAPCVVFIDEIDAVGRKRAMRGGNNEERDQTLNQLLVELDGFSEQQTIVVLAATNRVDILDDALLRPGRFDRRITLSTPDRNGREAILTVHTRAMPLSGDVDLARLARLTIGMSGADLANLANEAALTAARRDQKQIDHTCFEVALERIQLGVQRPLVMSDAERRTIAFHEGGHALVAYHLPEADRVNRVTILPRGQSLGVTQFSAESDRYNYSRETLMARIAVGLGGRVAEELIFGAERITTGAENDLQVVTDLARKMVTRWGMSERLGVVFADTQEQMSALQMRRSRAVHAIARTLRMDEQGNLVLNGADPMSEEDESAPIPTVPVWPSNTPQQALIDSEVQRILNEGRAIARALLTEHTDQLTLLADTLMEKELLDRKQFEQLLQP